MNSIKLHSILRKFGYFSRTLTFVPRLIGRWTFRSIRSVIFQLSVSRSVTFRRISNSADNESCQVVRNDNLKEEKKMLSIETKRCERYGFRVFG